ncbi:MAG: AbrB/MazE/SpoVT family DNA-binding domain-containing protein [Chloroflexota bacterium]
MKAIVSEKGQVTIPKRVRDRLGIRSGEVLDFEEQGGLLVGRKASFQDPIDHLYGILKGAATTDELLLELRGDDHP